MTRGCFRILSLILFALPVYLPRKSTSPLTIVSLQCINQIAIFFHHIIGINEVPTLFSSRVSIVRLSQSQIIRIPLQYFYVARGLISHRLLNHFPHEFGNVAILNEMVLMAFFYRFPDQHDLQGLGSPSSTMPSLLQNSALIFDNAGRSV